MNGQRSVLSEFAIASLVVGIASFISLAGIEKAIIAIVFGILALKRMEKDSQLGGKNLAIAGIVLGIFSIIAATVFIFKFLPKIQEQMIQMQGQGMGGSQQPEPTPGSKLF